MAADVGFTWLLPFVRRLRKIRTEKGNEEGEKDEDGQFWKEKIGCNPIPFPRDLMVGEASMRFHTTLTKRISETIPGKRMGEETNLTV